MKVAVLIALLFGVQFLRSQDIHFSLFEQAPQLLNPGSTGLFDGYERAMLLNKKQWAVMGQPYQTSYLSFDMPIFKAKRKRTSHLGVGGFLFNDKAGDANFRQFNSGISLASHLPISSNQMFSLGLQFGVGQLSADLTQIQWGNQYNGAGYDPSMNPMENLDMQRKVYADVSAGLVYSYQSRTSHFQGTEKREFQVGISTYHLNKPNYSFSGRTDEKLARRFTFYTSGHFALSNMPFSLKPQLYLNFQSGQIESLFGTYAIYHINAGTKFTGFITEKSIHFGLHYRVKDAVIPSLYYEYSNFLIGFAYDINTSSYKSSTSGRGGAELSLKYIGKIGALRKQRR